MHALRVSHFHLLLLLIVLFAVVRLHFVLFRAVSAQRSIYQRRLGEMISQRLLSVTRFLDPILETAGFRVDRGSVVYRRFPKPALVLFFVVWRIGLVERRKKYSRHHLAPFPHIHLLVFIVPTPLTHLHCGIGRHKLEKVLSV